MQDTAGREKVGRIHFYPPSEHNLPQGIMQEDEDKLRRQMEQYEKDGKFPAPADDEGH